MSGMRTVIRLGDFTFYSDEHPGSSGFTFADWSGWTDGPGRKRDAPARRGSAGAYRAKSYPTDRVVTWQGRYHGSSAADVAYMGRVLSGLEGLDLRVEVQREDVLWADAQVDRVRFAESGYASWADYQVELWMPDPHKYGQTRTFATSTNDVVTMHHRGNTRAVPRFTVAGTFPNGYALHASGRVVQVSGSATAITDTVDFRTGMVTRNGTLAPTRLQQAQFWDVPGGAELSWRLDRVGGTGTATAHVTDTYI